MSTTSRVIWACARCNGRFGITTPTNRHGITYSYFYCLNRQKRRSCEQRFAGTEKIEKEVATFWRTVRFPAVNIEALRADLTAKIDAELGSTSKQVPAQQRRIAKLERERRKLLQAFYADAIGQDLLREEQARITAEIAEAEQVAHDHDLKAERAYQFLEDLLTFCDDPHLLYVCADPTIRQMLNRAVVKRFWVWDEQIHTVELTPEFAAVQQQLAQAAESVSTAETGAVADASTPRIDASEAAQGATDNKAVCSPLSSYLKKINNTTNPRLTRGTRV